MSEKLFDVLALGNVAVDDLLYVPHFPVADSKVKVLRSTRQCGGLAATALVAAARVGARCAYAGVLGEGELSRFVESTLVREGVDVSRVVRRAGAAPVHSRIVVGEDNGTRNIFYEVIGSCGADDELPPEDFIRAARVLFVDPWGEAGTLRAARIARAAGIPIVSDIERSDFAGFDELFELTDHVIASEEFALLHTGAITPGEAAQQLWNEEREAVVVTCGARGCLVVAREYSDREPRFFPAYEVDVVDTTGCGDVFHGAYAALLAQGANLETRIRFAAATAALKATQPGGQQGIPSRDQVEKFLEKY